MGGQAARPATSAAPRTRTSMTRVAPSPSRTMRQASSSQTAGGRARSRRPPGRRSAASPRGARGHQQDRVVGGRVAVDRDRVEGVRRRRGAAPPAGTPASPARRSSRTRASSPCSGWIIPAPLAKPDDPADAAAARNVAARDLRPDVGRQDRLRGGVEPARRRAARRRRAAPRGSSRPAAATPITPVDARKTSRRVAAERARRPRWRTRRAPRSPARPVMALAQPALTTDRADASAAAFSAARERATGAAGKRLRVKIAAASRRPSATITARSGRLLANAGTHARGRRSRGAAS